MGLLFGSMFAQPTVMMKTKLVKQLWYDKNWRVAEDYDLWERAARAGWIMTNVPEVLLLYRQHGEQIIPARHFGLAEIKRVYRHYAMPPAQQIGLPQRAVYGRGEPGIAAAFGAQPRFFQILEGLMPVSEALYRFGFLEECAGLHVGCGGVTCA